MNKNINYIKKIFLIIFIIFISLNIIKSTGSVYADSIKVKENSGDKDSSQITGFERNMKNNHLYYHYKDSNNNSKTLDYGEGKSTSGVYQNYKWEISKGSKQWKQAVKDGLTNISNEISVTNDESGKSYTNGKIFFPRKGVSDVAETENGEVKRVVEPNGTTVSNKDNSDSTEDNSDSTEGDIGDGILGILLIGAKLGILAIGGAIALILSLFAGEGAQTLSVQDIIFNKVKITDINFFNIEGADGAIRTIRENVAAWYVGVRNLASVVLVIILIYVGIRMAISTIAEEKAKYKKMLKDWFTSMCLLFVLHYIIILTIQLNNTLVSAIGDASSTGDIGKQFFNNAVNNVYLTKGMANAICYLLLEAITFGFLIAYIKRMITIAFLIIIAPLVTITYSIDRMGDGKSQALNTWFKEFAYNILIQPFHCVAFLALCSTAVNLGEKANVADATLAICLLAFLAKSAEDIVKRIFGFEAQSMASPVAAAALGYSLAQNTAKFAQKIGKSASNKTPKIPQENDEKISNAGKNTTRTSENNLQVANSSQQKANNSQTVPIVGPNGKTLANVQKNKPQRGQIVNSNGIPISSKTNTQGKKQGQQIKQRKLTGQGKGGKLIRGFARGVLNANKYALTMGTGLALGASQGDLSNAMTGTTLGFEIGQSWAGRTPEKISGSHYRKNTARAFNNYKAETGMSDDEISKRSMDLLKGKIEPENDNDKELKSALVDMTNYFRNNGSNEDESYNQTNQVLKDITSGAQGEETGAERLTGNIKETYYKNQVKKYNKKLMDKNNYLTEQERREMERKRDEAKQFVIDKQAREKFVDRKNK